jgi:hypothetical protein
MEDGIEMYRTTLYDSIPANFTQNKKNVRINEKYIQTNEKKQYIYIYVPKYGELEDCIITHDLEEARQLLRSHNGALKVFYKDNITNTYIPTFIPFSSFSLQ